METVAIVGVGLIGGSVGLALRARGLAKRVVGIGRHPGKLAEAEAQGAIDVGELDLARGVAEADVVVVCTPVSRIADDVCRAAACGPQNLLVTDAGSTKRTIVEAVEADPQARAAFVGAHPIAGSERQGVASARADLFAGRVCVITPTDRTPPQRLEQARSFWSGLGCTIHEMPPDAHDDALALTSHLPHVVASALAASIPDELLAFAAGAYRDGTRVAAADADLWAAILLENRRPILKALAAYSFQLDEFRRALTDGDLSAIRSCWERGRARRGAFVS